MPESLNEGRNFAGEAIAAGLRPGGLVDAFLKFDNIKGEATAEGFEDTIEVLKWGWGVQNKGSFAVGQGGGAGKAAFGDLIVLKNVDKASPGLMLACASGQHIPKAVLSLRKSGGDAKLVYLVITLEDLLVSSTTVDQMPSSPDLVEAITLNYAKIKIEYKPQTAQGTAGAGSEFGWDLKIGKKL